MIVVYIAGPFRGPTAWAVAENVRAAERLGLQVARLGAMPLIPHANTMHFDGECSDQFWIDGTAELLQRCDALLTLPTWKASTGARGEVALAHELRVPVFHGIDEITQAVEAGWINMRRPT